MDCASCGHTNPTGSRFCSGCGASLAPRCPACGTETPAGARFCNGCGVALVAPGARPTADAVSRKIVTVVFADLIGSVSLHERLDAESARRLMDCYHRAMSATVDVHGGRVVQLLGDGVLAGFGVPRVAEDDAIRAVRAAVGMQRAFRELAREQGAAMENVGLRVAVNTGEIVVGDDENSVMGDPTNVAARLQQEARDGDVIVGEGTQRLVGELVTLAPLGTFALRGRAEAVAAYRVVSFDRPPSRQATAFVGRAEELCRLYAVYDAAVAAPAARLAVLLGSPGLGKSRLVAEFTRRAGERSTVLAARCDAAGGATFAPLAEALRALLSVDEGAGGDVLRAAIDSVMAGDDAERTRIATGIGALLAGTPAPPEETFFVVRRLLAALAAVRPVVLVIDDLQWAEPLLLDLVEHLVQWSAGVPLLVLVAARPELRDTRSSLATPGSLVTDVVTLGGLDAGAATRLAANVIGGSELPAALAGRVLATSEGNPLFVGELVRMLVQDGTLQRDGDRWITTVEIAKLDMPPTIQVLLAARIERLRPEERSVLERAAVIGRQFSRAAVAHLLRDAGDLDARLEALRRSELIEPDTGWLLGEPALRFHHVLIRDAAYRRVLKETRAELHARTADWIVARVGDAIEHDETIGWHLEQAHQHLRELGPLDDASRGLGERAARHLGAAGRRALARDDLPLAASLLGRAIDRLDAADPARADLALDWCEALLAAGDVGPAVAAIDELARLCGDSDRLRAWHTCFSGQLAVLTDPQALRTTADTVAAAAERLVALEDAAGEAKAHFVHAMALVRLGKVGACEAALDRALAAARRAGDRRRANAAMAGAPQAALWGPTPVTRASGRCLDVVRVLRITQGAPAVEAVALRCQALLEELRGRGDAARRMIASARKLVEELGVAQQVFEADVFAGHIELLEGDVVVAERCLRSAYDGLRERGLGIDAARAGALLGRALLAQDRAGEAEALSHESEALAGDDLKAAMGWRGVRAEALARRGEHGSALEFARAAVEIAAETDDLLDHADARISLAKAQRAAGRVAEADTEERRALELWEQKGATLLVQRAQSETSRVAAAAPAEQVQRPAPRTMGRRVRENHATAHLRRLDEAIAAGDFAAVSRLNTDDFEGVHHPSAIAAGAELPLTLFQRLSQHSENLEVAHEPLATLGDALALSRADWSASGFADEVFRIGAAASRWFVVIEADADERASRAEVFAEDHLGDAVACLYERHTARLPDGPERERAAAIARSVAAIISLRSSSTDRYRAILAPGVEFDDYRALAPLPPARGAVEWRQRVESWFAATEDSAYSIEDVLEVRPAGLVARLTERGHDRAGGGRFEIQVLNSYLFDAEGRLARIELFDADQQSEALARFDELVAPRAEPRVARRARPNRASVGARRVEAVIAARDLDAFIALHTTDFEHVHHPTGARFDMAGAIASLRMLFHARDAAYRLEPLAALGDSLALHRQSISAHAASGTRLDVGAYATESIVFSELAENGLCRRTEDFAPDKLGDAVVRLYERYAELLPEGPERARAAVTARWLALVTSPQPGRLLDELLDPGVEFVDHRRAGMPPTKGIDAFRRSVDAAHEIADDLADRWEDVLAAEPGLLLAQCVTKGRDRVGGGAFEWPHLRLCVFDAEGRATRLEAFDLEPREQALARFDELTREPVPEHPVRRRVPPNAVTASADRLERTIAARDRDALADPWSEKFECVDHSTGVVFGRSGIVSTWRSLLAAQNPYCRYEPLATLGDSLALLRFSRSGSEIAFGRFDVGAFERTEVQLLETDARGLVSRAEIFAAEKLGDAVVRLYERHAELLPEGPERERAAAVARAAAAYTGPMDLDRCAATQRSGMAYVDHRMIGFEPTHARDEFRRLLASLLDAAPGASQRYGDVLALRADAWLVRNTNVGTDRSSGGAYERPYLLLVATASDGLVTHIETFDIDRETEALARFDELDTERRPPRFENAARRAIERLIRCQNARDWEGVVASYSAHACLIDRRSLIGLNLTGRDLLANLRVIFDMGFHRWRSEMLATRGERLALFRGVSEAEGASAGATVEYVSVVEVDAYGRLDVIVAFDFEDLDAAYDELDARHAAGEGAPHAPLLARQRAVVQAFNAGDLEAVRRTLPEDFTVLDHRRVLGTDRPLRRDAWLGSLRDLDAFGNFAARIRIDHVLRLSATAGVVVMSASGTAGGGAVAWESVIVLTHDGHWPQSLEFFDTEQLDAALARFEALSREARPLPRIENAATRLCDRIASLVSARDLAGVSAMLAPGLRVIDRGRTAQLELDGGQHLDSLRFLLDMRDFRHTAKAIATRGQRLCLNRDLLHFADRDVGPSEIEALTVVEVDPSGELVTALVLFDADDLGAAYAELEARYAAGEAVLRGR